MDRIATSWKDYMLMQFNNNFEASMMNQNLSHLRPRYGESVFTTVSVGFFFILVGTIFATTPTLYDGLLVFLNSRSWTTYNVYNNIFIPVPVTPSAHLVVYRAAFESCLIWGFFQIFLLSFRLFVRSPPYREARTVSSMVFWLGVSYLINTYLNAMTTKATWYIFWITVMILAGITVIIRAIFLMAIKDLNSDRFRSF